jgi:hypothetical protein
LFSLEPIPMLTNKKEKKKIGSFHSFSKSARSPANSPSISMLGLPEPWTAFMYECWGTAELGTFLGSFFFFCHFSYPTLRPYNRILFFYYQVHPLVRPI